MKRSQKQIGQILRKALASKDVITFWRDRIDDYSEDGYVLIVRGDLLIMHKINDSLVLDGYLAVRLNDITRITLGKSKFYKETLRARNQRPRLPRRLQPRTMSDLLHYLKSPSNSVITVYREKNDHSQVLVGTIRLLSSSHVVMNLLTPAGEWGETTEPIRLSDISRVDFAGGYEEALTNYVEP